MIAPVAIFGLTVRGDIFSGSALTMILVAATLALLIGLDACPSARSDAGRRPASVARFERARTVGTGVDISRNDLIVAELLRGV